MTLDYHLRFSFVFVSNKKIQRELDMCRNKLSTNIIKDSRGLTRRSNMIKKSENQKSKVYILMKQELNFVRLFVRRRKRKSKKKVWKKLIKSLNFKRRDERKTMYDDIDRRKKNIKTPALWLVCLGRIFWFAH